jgi:catechol 2,3-dioxygenase-like lactoylglutathione lyase family enzyme
MKFTGYHHIGLAAKDVEKSLEFYTQGLGGTISASFPMGNTGKSIYLVDIGGHAVVEILPFGNDESETNPRWAHIALETDDARAAFAMAIKAGATIKSEPREIKLGTMAACNAFVLGPDGESIEFFQVG